MSSAFVKEGETPLLRDVEPTLGALLFFLRRENGGTPIKELKGYFSDKYNRDVFDMSDGLTYALGDEGRWFIILD